MTKKKRAVQQLTAEQRAEYHKNVAEEDHDVLRQQAREVKAELLAEHAALKERAGCPSPLEYDGTQGDE